jgi:hypothetical protein
MRRSVLAQHDRGILSANVAQVWRHSVLTKVAGKPSANYLRPPSCETPEISLASNTESRPARLVMVVTDF